MYTKFLEWGAKVVTTLLFVVSVILFAIVFIVRPMAPGRVEDIPLSSVERVEIVEPKLTNLVETIEKPAVDTVEIPIKINESMTVGDVGDIVDEPVEVDVDPEEVELLAKVIYQEAGGDKCCDECRRRVADVVLNRVADDRFPDTILEVLSERAQYGRYHWTGVIWPEKASAESEAHAVERAYRIAEEVLSGHHSELYGQGYIWQAEFVQGTDNVFHCNTYFGKG